MTPALHHPTHLLEDGAESAREGSEQVDARALRRREHRLAVFQAGHQRLLAQDMLARRRRHLCQLRVLGVLRADNYRLHIRRQKRFVAVERLRLELVCFGFRACGVVVGDSDQLRLRVLFEAERITVRVQVRETHDAHFDRHSVMTLPVCADSIAASASRTAL
jgi:hypothetical protein